MKLFQATFILLLSSCAVGQQLTSKDTQSVSPTTPKPTTTQSAAVPKHEDATKAAITADMPVITVANICEPTQKDCNTVVTRKQFETTLLGVSGGQMVPPEMPKRFASQYAEMLVFSKEAEKQGLDKESETVAALQFARIQVLATRYVRKLQEKSEPSSEEIQKYYDSNQARFQGTSLDRVMIPSGHAKSKNPDELKAMADDVHKRLTAGEDAAKLQQEIYTTLSLTNPPRTSITLRRGDPEREALMELPSGAVSDVITDQMALVVYRSHGKKPLPLDTVREEVYGKVYQQKVQAAVDAVMADHKSVLNDAYFGKETAKTSHHQ